MAPQLRRLRRPSSPLPSTSVHTRPPPPPPSSPSPSPKATTIHSLPPELLQTILFHALLPTTTRSWLTPADLSSRTAQSLQRVSPSFRSAFHNCITRFSFFLVNPHASSPHASQTHAHVIPTLVRAPALRELQLFIRPRDVCVAAAVARLFASTRAPLSAVHLCCAPPAAGDCLRAGDALPVVTDLVRAIASRGPRLERLSLDCCSRISAPAAELLADRVGASLRRLALDVTFFDDWDVLGRFQALEELRLQNTRLISDDSLGRLLRKLKSLEVLEIHQVPNVGAASLAPLVDVGRLRSIELSRCLSMDNDAVLALPDIQTLTTVSLCYIDVSAETLKSLARRMGDRLRSLSVNAISTEGAVGLSTSDTLTPPSPPHSPMLTPSHVSASSLPDAPSCIQSLLDTVKSECPNSTLHFGESMRPSHWSARPFAEALQHSTPPPLAVHLHDAPTRMPRQIAFRMRSQRKRALLRTSREGRFGAGDGQGSSRWARARPLSSCF